MRSATKVSIVQRPTLRSAVLPKNEMTLDQKLDSSLDDVILRKGNSRLTAKTPEDSKPKPTSRTTPQNRMYPSVIKSLRASAPAPLRVAPHKGGPEIWRAPSAPQPVEPQRRRVVMTVAPRSANVRAAVILPAEEDPKPTRRASRFDEGVCRMDGPVRWQHVGDEGGGVAGSAGGASRRVVMSTNAESGTVRSVKRTREDEEDELLQKAKIQREEKLREERERRERIAAYDRMREAEKLRMEKRRALEKEEERKKEKEAEELRRREEEKKEQRAREEREERAAESKYRTERERIRDEPPRRRGDSRERKKEQPRRRRYRGDSEEDVEDSSIERELMEEQRRMKDEAHRRTRSDHHETRPADKSRVSGGGTPEDSRGASKNEQDRQESAGGEPASCQTDGRLRWPGKEEEVYNFSEEEWDFMRKLSIYTNLQRLPPPIDVQVCSVSEVSLPAVYGGKRGARGTSGGPTHSAKDDRSP